jgi:N-acetylglucosaminyldiphosphoundecaprenol N-acetyl-beta-D-mannosaminyltransferase
MTARPPIAIMGVPIDNVSAAEALASIERMVVSRRPHYFATVNVDFLVQAQTDVELHRILADADLVTCDGAPVWWASRILGNPLVERVTGSDLLSPLLSLAARRRFRVFILGATPASAADAVRRAKERHPDLTIAHYSPPFVELGDLDQQEIARRIRGAEPHILLVALGCPKQEKWIAANYRALGVPVSGGVGATIDFLSGHARRSPAWLRRVGLEWVFRLWCEPRRLFGRYWRDFRVFGRGLARQYWHLRDGSREPAPDRGARVEDAAAWQCLELPRRLDLAALKADPLLAPELLADGRDCVLQASDTVGVDSSGIAFLLRLRKGIDATGRKLILVAPTANLRRALKLMRIEGFFVIAPDLAAVRTRLRCRDRREPV